MKNIIQSQLSEADRTKINGFIADLETILAGKIRRLDAAERSRYGSINQQNKLVVDIARNYHQNQPAMSSPDVDWTEFESDYENRMFLTNCISRLSAIVRDLESTKIMHDYDNFQDALDDYGYSRYRDGAGETGYSAKVAEFKQYFTKSNKNNPPDEDGDKPPEGGGENTT
ncbi:MAG TPA: hypothetical protein VNB22_07220 [Pyrinomonadaceae bacterium]|jgi:hypothetical protein|nr:hypothetical protein [Pyrinomonadaceae bacterium]